MDHPVCYLTIELPGGLIPRVFHFWENMDIPGALSLSNKKKDTRDDSPWIFAWAMDHTPDISDVRSLICLQAGLADIPLPSPLDFTVDPIDPDTNWLLKTYQSFAPFSIGPFFLKGSHDKDKKGPDGSIDLLIDAVTAFGSGEHPTTRGCLEYLSDLKAEGYVPNRVLDVGTGSGILAIAAWKLWQKPVFATDIDRESVRVACAYRTLNQIPSGHTGMMCKQASRVNLPSVQKQGPYDLIIANILAITLRELASNITSAADTPSTLILSGILDHQADDVIAAYTPLGYRLVSKKPIAEWTTLRLMRA
jgi:ribosomal protein L11 methyltransferase